MKLSYSEKDTILKKTLKQKYNRNCKIKKKNKTRENRRCKVSKEVCIKEDPYIQYRCKCAQTDHIPLIRLCFKCCPRGEYFLACDVCPAANITQTRGF